MELERRRGVRSSYFLLGFWFLDVCRESLGLYTAVRLQEYAASQQEDMFHIIDWWMDGWMDGLMDWWIGSFVWYFGWFLFDVFCVRFLVLPLPYYTCMCTIFPYVCCLYAIIVCSFTEVSPDPTFSSVDHRWKGTLSASAPLGCYISRYHRIHVRQWPIGGCDTHDTEVS